MNVPNFLGNYINETIPQYTGIGLTENRLSP